jgi:hypothetical protein
MVAFLRERRHAGVTSTSAVVSLAPANPRKNKLEVGWMTERPSVQVPLGSHDSALVDDPR